MRKCGDEELNREGIYSRKLRQQLLSLQTLALLRIEL